MTNANMYTIPTVIEKTGRGERAYDIYSRLLEDRIVFIGTPIDDGVANVEVMGISDPFVDDDTAKATPGRPGISKEARQEKYNQAAQEIFDFFFVTFPSVVVAYCETDRATKCPTMSVGHTWPDLWFLANRRLGKHVEGVPASLPML